MSVQLPTAFDRVLLPRRWFIVLCSLVERLLESLDLDLQRRHAPDVDDVCFSLAAAAVIAGSYAASPPGTARHQSFALLQVAGALYAWLLASWLVHWVLREFKRAGERKV